MISYYKLHTRFGYHLELFLILDFHKISLIISCILELNFQSTIFLIQQALLEENLNTQINYNRWYGTDKRLREESFKLKSKLLLSFLEKLASKKWLISYLQTDFQLSFHRKKWRNLTQGEDQFTCGSFRSSCEWRI